MARTKKYPFAELDPESRAYLLQARERGGDGMPGVYVPLADFLPAIGLCSGLAVLIGTAVLAYNLIEEEPLGVAMLQTAGLLLGGWLVLYALRTWATARSSSHAGHFVYADAETLWECTGQTVWATDLVGIVGASKAEELTKEGKYTHTEVTVRTDRHRRLFKVRDRQGGRILVRFLNDLAWLRSSDDDDRPEDGEDPVPADCRDLSPAIMGGLAKEMAESGEIPRDLSVDALGLDVVEVPLPQKAGPASSVWLHWLLASLLVGVVGAGCVLVFKKLNVGWRDAAIFDFVSQIEDADTRAPWLRAYLADPRNTRHRDDARQMLRTIYASAVNRIRAGFVPNPAGNPNFPNFPAPVAAGARVDNELVDGLEVVLKELAEQPLALVSVSVREKGNRDGARQREQEFLQKYTLALLDGVGDELIAFAQGPPEMVGMIAVDYEYQLAAPGPGATWSCKITFSFRKSTEGEAIKTVKREIIKQPPPSLASVGALAASLGVRTAGPKKPIWQPQEF